MNNKTFKKNYPCYKLKRVSNYKNNEEDIFFIPMIKLSFFSRWKYLDEWFCDYYNNMYHNSIIIYFKSGLLHKIKDLEKAIQLILSVEYLGTVYKFNKDIRPMSIIKGSDERVIVEIKIEKIK